MKNKLISILFLLSYLSLLAYLVKAFIPGFLILVSPEKASAKVIEWTQEDNKAFIKYEYLNSTDSNRYTIVTEVKRRFIQELKNKKEIEIKYSKYFPDFTIISDIGDRKLIFPTIGILIMIMGIYFISKVLCGKLSLEEFIGVKRIHHSSK